MIKIARVVKDFGVWTTKRLYRCDPPLDGYEYVVASATLASDTGLDETLVFGANRDGQIVNWMDLPCSFEGSQNHDRALQNAGYVVVGQDARN